ncbi:type I pullulanase [Mesobacillus maritimus]|uniref:Type I pullulanase n=1 Tax=Mesobacillus maritimus TaxID=1643336 RepID=A0ABS7K9L4_9BACI|nr:type I pullulanase [Mesobacillus maritimus]MBY0098952.1 type I pullulanase [Mesobacillus maritimus]
MEAINRLFYAYLDEMQMITILLPYSYHKGESSAFYLLNEAEMIPLEIREKIHLPQSLKYVCYSQITPQIGSSYNIKDEYGGQTDLQVGAVIRTKEFDEAFYYSGDDLGVTLRSNKTVFKVWAPTATQVKLKISADEKSSPEYVMLNREAKGIWMVEVEKNLEGYRYSYQACINLEWREAVDPYAKAVSVNGQMGVVVDLEKTATSKPQLPNLANPCDAIIYETHIRDLTIHPSSGVKHKGTYLGAAELGTKSSSGEPTGLSYIKDLGVTHIEFLPFHDFEGVDELNPNHEYNWGYNPVHFNVPDGSYSSDPSDPYKRIIELKQLIATIHSQGLRVIMDAVYNHVYIRENSPFEKLVPGYYFRHGENGLPSNGTGVGNDFASERLMARKFILDSVRYWMEEYQIDGLRFDLMGILDITTMQAVRELVSSLDSAAIIIGEGWDLNTPIPHDEKATIGNQEKIPTIGQFNDWFRDTIKGSTFNLYDRGYALGNERYTEAAKQVLAGSIGVERRKTGLFLNPTQTVNYVESHDNHTLWDKLEACEQDNIEQRHRLATALVILAQGIPFIHSGQEFFRTKKGIGNSYKSPDEINWLDWNRRDAHLENIRYLKGMISIRNSHQAFRLPEAALVRKHLHFLPLPPPLIGYRLSEVEKFGDWQEIITFINPTNERKIVHFPEKTCWKILANSQCASATPVDEIREKCVNIEACSLLIAAR